MPAKIKEFLDSDAIDRALTRIAHEILERNVGTKDIVLLGVPTRGHHLALRIQKKILEIEKVEVPTGSLDATLYRDDIAIKSDAPPLKAMDIPFSINDKVVVIVDDVLFTGRTIRAAMNALTDFGRSRRIQLAVLVDRGHRELPIKADYVGKNVPTSLSDEVRVRLSEVDDENTVTVSEKKPPETKKDGK